MITTYKREDFGLMKVFFVVENGEVTSITAGNQVVPVEMGYQFFVEEHVALQIDKCELYMDGVTPKLRVKEGEEIELPQKTDEELRIEQLERELYNLKKPKEIDEDD